MFCRSRRDWPRLSVVAVKVSPECLCEPAGWVKSVCEVGEHVYGGSRNFFMSGQEWLNASEGVGGSRQESSRVIAEVSRIGHEGLHE